MALISPANLILLTDKIAYLWDRLGLAVGTQPYPSNPRGTGGWLIAQSLAGILGTLDYQQVEDLAQVSHDAASGFTRSALAAQSFGGVLSAIDSHVGGQGSLLDASVVDLASYLLWYANSAPFTVLLHPSFAACWLAATGNALPAVGIEQPSLHPLLNPVAASGLGTRAVGAAFVPGAVPDTNYESVRVGVQVTTTFSGGTVPPTVTVSGVDHLGNATTTWTGVIPGNNPAASVSTTITPAILASSRVTVAVASPTGIVAGSVLTVNAGLVDQEVISVESVSGSTITAVFDQAHAGGSSLVGGTTVILTPSLTGARVESVTGLALGLTGHSAGAVLLFGVLDRQHDPS